MQYVCIYIHAWASHQIVSRKTKLKLGLSINNYNKFNVFQAMIDILAYFAAV